MSEIPVYLDGILKLYKLVGTNDIYSIKKPVYQNIDIFFREESIGDSLKSELAQNKVEVTTKIIIPQYKEITSEFVVEINEEKHKVFNVYHFVDKNGFKETRLTLEKLYE